MEQEIRDYLIMTTIALAIALIVPLVSWSMLTDETSREMICIASIVIGVIAGLSFVFINRRRDIFWSSERSTCERLREASSITSLLAVVPLMESIVLIIIHPEFGANDFMLLSGIMVFVSMLIQAFFWKKVDAIGALGSFSILMLIVSLIFLNLSSILAINHGGAAMLVASALFAVAPILLMFDWAWSANASTIMALIAALATTVITVTDDITQFGLLLAFWIPAVFLVLIRIPMRASSLVHDGQRLF
ncbi:MAG: hypothetical protein E7Z70_05545 [Thermoplasmata archaeon]|nr:hypothetical protein [Thermoplasmata archaeon]